MTGKQHKAQNVGGPVITITTIRHSLQWHKLSSWTVKPLIFFSLFFTSFFVISCTTTPLETSAPPVLKLEEVSCTEAWYRLTAHGYKLPLQAEVYRDNKLTSQFTVNTFEKIFYIDSLLPKHSYTVSVSLTAANGEKTTLSENIVTMDTTSHDIVWQDYTFGDIPTSMLRDVTITELGNIFAVGLLSYKAPMDTDVLSIEYNLIESTSNGWEQRQEKFYPFRGNTSRGVYDAYSVCEYLPDKLLISIPGQVMYWDGTQLPPLEFIDDWITSYWKNSNGEIWGAGERGGIEHFNGTNWEYLKTNSTVPLNSISGSDETGIIWASGYNQLRRSALFKIQNNKVSEYWSDGQPEKLPIQSNDKIIASCVIGKELYLVSAAYDKLYKISLLDSTIYRYEYETTEFGKMLFKMRYFVGEINAMAKNDIFIICHYGAIYHYNGYTWKLIDQFMDFDNPSVLKRLHINKNKIAIVGQKGYKAYLITGTR